MGFNVIDNHCRLYPTLVEELCGVQIVKVVAGTHHSLALTSYSQVSCVLLSNVPVVDLA